MTRKTPGAPKGAISPVLARMGSKPKATTIQPDGKLELVPKLRFPEFRDAAGWKEVALGDIAEIKLGKMLDKKKHTTGRRLPYLNNMSVRWNEVNTSNLPQMYFDDGELDRFGLRAGDVVVCEGGEPGRAAVWDGRMPDLKFQKAIHRVRFNVAFEADLLVLHLEKLAGTIQFEMLFTGGGIRHLTRETFAQLKIPHIPYAEQQKIARCLSSLGELIAAQARKLDALKTHKKWLMQQLFPREGETQPRLCFPEFQNDGEWKMRTMGSFASFSSGGTPSKDNPAYWNGSIPWISASSMYDLIIEKSDHYVTPLAIGNGTRIAKKGSILILVRGSMLFKRVPICVAGTDVAFNQDVKALDVEASINTSFLLYQLSNFQSRIPINETGIGAGKIELDHLKGFELFFPEVPQQQRIADCLTSLDDLIAAQTQKLDALKTHKKGLMQQLFPSPEAVEA